MDFFDLEMSFDLIIEQTFFCALDPSLREKYISKSHSLLNENGRIIGLLFNIDFGFPHPPYGGHKSEYEPVIC